jgi:hypothetical protein
MVGKGAQYAAFADKAGTDLNGANENFVAGRQGVSRIPFRPFNKIRFCSRNLSSRAG